MREQDFWDTTPRAFFNAVEGYRIRRQEDLELLRLQTVYFVNVWRDKKDVIRDPRKLWQYSWEKKVITADDVKRLREKGKKLARQWAKTK